MAGKLITLEACEGAGKTTAVDFIGECLRHSGHTVTQTREIGGSPLAEQVREMLADPVMKAYGMDAVQEILLMFAARDNHVKTVVAPHLASGKMVLSDRFYDSTYAYQHYGRGGSKELIDTLVRVTQCPVPDLTILLDVAADVGMARVVGRGTLDRFEMEAVEFHERVRAGYLAMAKDDTSGRWQVIDASQSIPSVRGQILQTLFKRGLVTMQGAYLARLQYTVEGFSL